MSQSSLASRPAFGPTADDIARDGNVYRYSVRCDRATFHRIEAAAKRAGMSGTSFVQKYFDKILDAPAPDKVEAALPFIPSDFARRHGLPLPAAALYGVMRARAGRDHRLTIKNDQLCDLAGLTPHRLARAIDLLEHNCLVERAGKVGAHGSEFVVREAC